MPFSFHFLIKNKTNRMKHVFYAMVCLFLATTPAYSTVQTVTPPVAQQKLSFKERVLLKVLSLKMKYWDGKSLISKDLTGDCAKIVLKDGDVIEANIIQITPVEVKYKRCGKPNDPETILYKKDILSIKAADGEIIYRNTGNNASRTAASMPSSNNDGPAYDGYSIAALVTGIAGLLLFNTWIGLAAGICGIVFGYMSLKRINANPEMYKGKNMARAGLITGIIACALFTLVLASVIR
jgi:hypothetical protein